MGRQLCDRYTGGNPPPLSVTPPGICDHCGKACMILQQAGGLTNAEPGIRCYHCGVGTFRHRGRWAWTWCACKWSNPFCTTCHGHGVVGTWIG